MTNDNNFFAWFIVRDLQYRNVLFQNSTKVMSLNMLFIYVIS